MRPIPHGFPGVLSGILLSLVLAANAQPTNDNFADAVELLIDNYCSTNAQFTTVSATPDGPLPSKWASINSNVWFKFQAKGSRVTIYLNTGEAEGSLRNPNLALHDASLAELQSVGSAGNYTDRIIEHTNLTIGEWYFINVGNGFHSTHPGTFSLCVDNGLGNNNKVDALELTVLSYWDSPSTLFNNLESTNDGPVPSVYPSLGNNVWFKFRAVTQGIQIELNLGTLSASDYVLALFDSNDNEIDASRFNLGPVLSSNQLIPGEWYYLSVGGGEGTFGLSVNDQLGNDFRSEAIDVTLSSDAWVSTADAYDNYYSTNDGPVPSVYPSLGNNVWFKFQASDTVLRITLHRNTMPNTHVLALFDEGLNEVTSTRFNLGDELMAGGLQTGQWYYLSVGSDRPNSGTSSTFGLEIEKGVAKNSLEIQALRDLYENTNGASWVNSTGWPSTPLEWEGITTLDQLVGWHGIQTEGGDVIRIDLSSNQLEGELPASLSLLTGLREFLIPSNNLSGPLPSISNLTELVHFQVHGGNRFSGALPSGVENLNKLITFLVSDNRFSGAVPVGFTNLSSLRVFRVDGNLFTTFPDFTGNANAHLMTVDIHDNYIPQADIDVNMPGGVPIFRDFFSSPQYVWNSAPDADEISFLRSLYENTNGAGWVNSTGWPSTPLEWEGITSLDQLVGWHGIQTEGGDVVRIDFRSNQLAGELPTSLSLMTGLRELLLSSNNLSGPLPSISNLTELIHFQVHGGNRFSGALPSGVENLNKLITFLVSDNQFSGAVPVGFSNLSLLRVFRVDGNLLTTFPDFTGNANAHLITVDIHDNYIPQADIDVNMPGGTPIFSLFIYSPQKSISVEQGLALDQVEIAALRDLYTSTNGANWTNNTGWPSAPTEWDTITSVDQVTGWHGITVENGDVTRISLNSNGLMGSLPQTIGNLSELKRLWFYLNSLHGELPASIYSLNKLTQLNLAANDFTGPLDPRVGGMDALGLLRIGGNEFDVPLPIEIGNLENLWSLTINEIALNSEIPGWVSSLGNLSELSMKNCGLTGRIPGSFSNLVNLKLLFLGRNNLEGEIPDFTGLTKLEMLDLELNSNLSGDLSEKFSMLDNFTMFSVHTNLFTGLPDFSNIPMPGALSIKAYRNLFSFGEIEANLNPDGTHSYRSFGYDPQNAPQEISVIEILINEPISLLNNRGDGVNTSYQWQEWDGTQWLNVVGETSASLGFDTISIQDDGRLFRCEMTNSLVTGMILYSQEVELKVIIPLTFYAVANGHWSDPSTWSETDGGLPGGKTPTKYDEVRIGDYQVKVDGPAECRLLKITAGEPTLLKITGKEAVLTVNGEVTIHNAGAVNNKILQVSDQGHLECK